MVFSCVLLIALCLALPGVVILLDASTQRLDIQEAEARLAGLQKKIGRSREEQRTKKNGWEFSLSPKGGRGLPFLAEECEAIDLSQDIAREKNRRERYARQKPLGYVRIGLGMALLVFYWFVLRRLVQRALEKAQHPADTV